MKYFDLDTLKFLQNDVHDLPGLLSAKLFEDHDEESINLFLDSIKDFSDKELYPFIREMDEFGAKFEDGTVKTHPQIKNVIKKGGDMGLISALFDYDEGGMQLPFTAYTSAGFIMEAANNHAIGYMSLTFGAAELIMEFGSEELKKTYASRMITGEWTGTMCLTEPQAGSSLSDIVTSATPTDDGSYRIKGQKIFISGGDHEHTDNIVHLLLARIDGAPKGTKGISLFVVPKNRVVPSGELLPNGVTTAGDFQKMGQKGYCTTHLMFGEQEECHGYLVGEVNRGLHCMFLMMNGARIAVGRGAAAIATAAYYSSLQYAHERPQGRKIKSTGAKNVNDEQALIINHADVRRMLLLQKAVVEGSQSLILLASRYYDIIRTSEDETQKENTKLLLELLTPVVKTYPSEMGIVACNNAVQVLGGYGFCTEYDPQMYLRDIRISAIYEGTTGIQSIDLLGRKIPMKGGKAVQLLAGEMMKTIQQALSYDDLKPYTSALSEKLQLVQKVMGHLSQFAEKGDFERYLSDATIFMEMFSKIVVGWLWLDMATVAKQALVTGKKNYSDEFYESKIHTMRYYFKYEMNRTNSLADILMDDDVLTIVGEKELIV